MSPTNPIYAAHAAQLSVSPACPTGTADLPRAGPIGLVGVQHCFQHCWPPQVKAVGSGYWRVIGSVAQLVEKTEALGLRWLKGIGMARRLAVDTHHAPP